MQNNLGVVGSGAAIIRDSGSSGLVNKEDRRKGHIMMSEPKLKKLYILAIPMVLIMLGMRAIAEVTLIESGKPVATIVLPDHPTGQERVAAKDIQLHLLKMSGTQLPIVAEKDRPEGLCMDIGGTVHGLAWRRKLAKRVDLNDEALVINVTPGQVVFVGRTNQATTHAASIVLEQLGVRWLLPTEKGTYIPARRTVRLDEQSTIDQPAFIMRRGLPVQHGLDPTPPQKISREKWNIHVAAWSRRQRQGGLDWTAGHAYSHLVSPDAYFDGHPEYYSLRHGERRKSQLCTTNPSVVRIATESARGITKATPHRLIGVGPNDGESFCQCENCSKLIFKAGQQYDIIVDFANQIARDVGEQFPKARFYFFANYHSGMNPPLRIKPEPNLVFWLVRWNVDQAHSIYHPNAKSFKSAIGKWTEYGRAHNNMIVLYTYYGHYSNFLYYPIVHVLKDEFPYFQDHNIRGMYSQTQQHWGCQGLNFYVYSRLMWNPKADVDAMVEEYCRLAFGPAGKTMQQYYDLLETAVEQSSGFRGYMAEVPKIFTPQIVAQADVLMNKAVGQVEKHVASHPDPGLLWRIHLVARGQRMAKLYLDSHHRLSGYISAEQAGKHPDRTILKQVKVSLTEVVKMMKDSNHPDLLDGASGFISPIEKTLQYIRFPGRLVYGPGNFSYVDHLMGEQASLTCRKFEGFVPGVNLPLGPKSFGEVVWRFEAEDQCVFETAYFQTTHFNCPSRLSGGTNQLAIRSPVTNGKYVAIAENETVSADNFYKYFTQHISGADWFEVRYRAHNAQNKQVAVMDVFAVAGTVARISE